MANINYLSLSQNQLTGAPSLFPLNCSQKKEKLVRNKLVFFSPFVQVGQVDLFFVCLCFDCVLYTPGPIPAELGQLAKLKQLWMSSNKLTGTLSPLLLTLMCAIYEVGDLPCISSIMFVLCFN